MFGYGPKFDLALGVLDLAHLKHRGFEMTITGGRDGKHRDNSFHYARTWDDRRWPLNPMGSQGAVDIRTWKYSWTPPQLSWQAKTELALALREALDKVWPGAFQVIVEKTHIHIEHDPAAIPGRIT